MRRYDPAPKRFSRIECSPKLYASHSELQLDFGLMDQSLIDQKTGTLKPVPGSPFKTAKGQKLRFGTGSCLLFLVVPVNIYLTGAIENRISVRFAKIVPTPFHKGFNFRTGSGEERSMYSEPGGESNRALEFVAMFANFSHGGIAPDHR